MMLSLDVICHVSTLADPSAPLY